MWYETYKPEPLLDYSKPIIAKHPNGTHDHILLPMIRSGSYNNAGWNWFNLRDGAWASCSTFKTVEEAIKARRGYIITNVYLDVEETYMGS